MAAVMAPVAEDSSSNSTSSFDSSTDAIVHIVVPSLFGLISLVGSVGNALVIAVFALNRTMRNSTNVLILNLATADLAFVLFCVPFTAAQYSLATWPFGQLWCKAVTYLQYVSALASVWTLVLMAVERYLAVAYPVQAAVSIRSMRTAGVALAGLWAAILLSQLHVFAAQDVYEYTFKGMNRSSCVLHAQTEEGRNGSHAALLVRFHYFSFNIMAFFLPLSITSVLYVLMVRELWRSKLRLTLSESSMAMKRRITAMVFSVTLVFTLCWLPQNVWFLWQGLAFPRQIVTDNADLALQLTFQILSYTNSCVNPLLYGTLSTNFRHGFENAVSLVFRGKAPHRLQRQESSKARETRRSGKRPSVKQRIMRQISRSTLMRRGTTQETMAVSEGVAPQLDLCRSSTKKRRSLPASVRDAVEMPAGTAKALLSPPRTDEASSHFSRDETFHLSELTPNPPATPNFQPRNERVESCASPEPLLSPNTTIDDDDVEQFV